MPTEADFRALLVDAARQRRNRHAPVAALARRDATVAQTVIEHPGWSMFHGELSERVEVCRRERQALEVRLIYEYMPQDRWDWLRGDVRRLTGVIEGLTHALALIPEAVKQGQEAGAGDLA